MPGFSAQAGDGVMEKGGRVYTGGRGAAASGEQPTRAALFQTLGWAGRQGDAPHSIRQPPLSMSSPQLHLSTKRSSFVRATLPESAPPPRLRWHLRRREVVSSFLRYPKEPTHLGPYLGPLLLSDHCLQFLSPFLRLGFKTLPSPSLPSQARGAKAQKWDEPLSPSSLHSTLKFLL